MEREEVLKYKFVHNQDVQIRYNDIDTNGHVNNGVYNSYFDIGRVSYFSSVFNKENPLAEITDLIVAQVNITYLLPVVYGNSLKVKSTIIRWGNSSFDMLQALFIQNGDDQLLASYCVTTFVHLSNEKPSAVPETWKVAVKEYENN